MTDDARPGNVPARRASAAAAPAARPALRRPRPPLLSPPLPPRGTARPAPRAVVTCSARASPRPLGPAPAPPGDRRAARRAARRARMARCGRFRTDPKPELVQGSVREVPLPSPLQERSDRGLRARVEVHLARGKKPRPSVTTPSGRQVRSGILA